MPYIVVTGGAGFIGANFVLDWLRDDGADSIVNLDKLTYAGHLESLASLGASDRHVQLRLDVCDRAALDQVFRTYLPRAVVHFAAESHVDRSIWGPGDFIQANVVGTYTLLDAAHTYWSGLRGTDKANFRFLHVSTDEVYGSLEPNLSPFTEASPYAPSSPYSATKAASDHLVRASYVTYGLPAITVHASNNYGPFQLPEKLIPLTITRALAGMSLPLYGDGLHVRDWLYVKDNCAMLRLALQGGRVGETYNVGADSPKTNLEVVGAVCDLLDELRPRSTGSYREQIVFVSDRPGHDRRYVVDARKARAELGWLPYESFDTGLRKTVQWYLEHDEWVRVVTSGLHN